MNFCLRVDLTFIAGVRKWQPRGAAERGGLLLRGRRRVLEALGSYGKILVILVHAGAGQPSVGSHGSRSLADIFAGALAIKRR